MGRLGNIEKKAKTVSLGIFYLEYLVRFLIGALAIVGSAVIIFNVLLYSDIVYPANYAEKQAKIAYENIMEQQKVIEEMIPEVCQYAVLSENGNVKSGNMKKKDIRKVWKESEIFHQSRSEYTIHAVSKQIGTNYYEIIKLEQEYCILQYKIIAQYQSPFLRKYFLPPETMMIVCTILLLLFYGIWSAVCFGNALKEKLNILIDATEKIQANDLEFSVTSSGIKEIDTVLDSMDEMRTALKESLEAQWKSEQQKNEQIAALAHDLKTPLTLIRGNAELLFDMDPDEEQKECITFIADSSIQMQTYVQMMLEVTTSSDILRMKKKAVDLSAFLQEIKEKYRGLCSTKKIVPQWDCVYHTQMVTVDEVFLTRALLNVVANAVEYTPADGVISFEVRETDEHIVFVISDTGKGFSPEALRHATEQFYMEDASRSSRQHFGIGLYLADSVAKQHDGSLTVGNSKRTCGAEVSIMIPC